MYIHIHLNFYILQNNNAHIYRRIKNKTYISFANIFDSIYKKRINTQRDLINILILLKIPYEKLEVANRYAINNAICF